jgi:DnaJ family protein B protein 4
MSDLYKILEVDKSATGDEIKKAYRRLSMKWHPDKNSSPEASDKFKELSKAYAVLSDEKQRREYDMSGEGFDMSSINLPDLFKVFMGAGGGMPFMPGMVHVDLSGMAPGMTSGIASGMPSGMPPGMPPGMASGMASGMAPEGGFSVESLFHNLRKPPPIIANIGISLKDAYHGISYPLKINRWIMTGNTKTYEDETIYITISPGIDDNEIIVAREKGNILSESIRGDVKVFINIENDNNFARHGLDLDYTKIISLKEALCGFSFEIEHINGICYKINNTNGTIIHPSYKKTIPKKGMVRDGMEGNLNIHFIVEFPKTLSKEVIQELGKLL